MYASTRDWPACNGSRPGIQGGKFFDLSWTIRGPETCTCVCVCVCVLVCVCLGVCMCVEIRSFVLCMCLRVGTLYGETERWSQRSFGTPEVSSCIGRASAGQREDSGRTAAEDSQ
jgi:hypothetical protein